MQIRNLQLLARVLEVPIHDLHGDEERLLVAVEVREHLDHPVDHAGAHRPLDLMTIQAVGCVKLRTRLPIL